MCLHVVTSTEDALANRTPGLARVQVLVQCQRHRVLETLPTNSTAKQEAGVRRTAGLTVIVVRDELGAAGRNGVVDDDGGGCGGDGVVVVSRGSLYKETTNTQQSPRFVGHCGASACEWLAGLLDPAGRCRCEQVRAPTRSFRHPELANQPPACDTP